VRLSKEHVKEVVPVLIECKLNRFYGHFEGDAQKYRLKDEVKNLKQNKDCLKIFADRVVDQGLLKIEQLAKIDELVAEEINFAVNHAKTSEKPSSADLLTDVYVSYP